MNIHSFSMTKRNQILRETQIKPEKGINKMYKDVKKQVLHFILRMYTEHIQRKQEQAIFEDNNSGLKT